MPGTALAMPPIEDMSDAESDEILVVDSKPMEKESSRAPTSPLSHRPRRSTSRAVQDKVVETIEDEEEDGGSEAAFAKKVQVRVAVPTPLNRAEYEQIAEDDTVVKVVDQGGDGRFKIIYADGREDTVSLFVISSFCSLLPYAPSRLKFSTTNCSRARAVAFCCLDTPRDTTTSTCFRVFNSFTLNTSNFSPRIKLLLRGDY